MLFLRKMLIFEVVIFLTFWYYGTLALNADDAMISKFHQNTYKLRNQRADIVSVNREYFERFEIKTFKFNRTVTAFNLTVSCKRDMGTELDIVWQAYKRYSNEYRLFPMRMRINYCRYFNNDVFGLLNSLKCGNASKTCTMNKNAVYHACNFVVDETKFPPLVPTGEFKAEMIWMYGDEEIAVMDAYAEIYVPINIP